MVCSGVGAVFRATWDEWADKTGLQGISNARKTKSHLCRSFVWTLLFIAGLVGTVYAVYLVFAAYLQYPVNTSVTLVYTTTVSFPAVTVCNQNRVDCNRLSQLLSGCRSNVTNATFVCPFANEHIGMAADIYQSGCANKTSSSTSGPTSGGQTGNAVNTTQSTMTGNTTTSKSQTTTTAAPNQTTTSTPTLSTSTSTTSHATAAATSSTTAVTSNNTTLTTATTTITTTTTRTTTGSSTLSTSVTATTTTSSTTTTTGSSTTASAAPPSSGRRKRAAEGGMAPPTLSQLGQPPAAVNDAYDFLTKLMGLTESERIAIGASWDTFVKACTFKERDCLNESNFLVSNTATFGNCFSFNSELNSEDSFAGQRVSSMSGPNFGLTLVLNLDQANYLLNGNTQQAGARLVVHNVTESPLVDEFGADLLPSVLTRVAVQNTEVYRYPAPYTSDCYANWTNSNLTRYVTGNYSYTVQHCQRLCLFDHFAASCGCFHPLYLDSDEIRHYGQRPCDLTTNSNDSACVDNIIALLDAATIVCDCHVACTESLYPITISQSVWPSVQYLPIATSTYGFSGLAASAPGLQDNLVQVQVYFSTLNVQTIQESPVYSWDDGSFVSALGGALSLYIGLSFAMFFELFEFLLDLFVNGYSYTRRGKHMDAQSQPSQNSSQLQAWSPGFDYKPPFAEKAE